MSLHQLEIQLVAVLVSIACALPGVFLVLRRMALMSDAISHSILPGIVAAFFLTGNIASPLLIIAAALTGLFTVFAVEFLAGSRLVREDAAIGLVFPLLFSIGVILVAKYAGNVHLDMDAVLLGELAFAPFNRLELFGRDLGAMALYVMGGILLLNVAFIAFFYKELKISTFDAALAATLGFSPVLLHYGLMAVVSITAVGAFDAVGSVLVVALMIAPPAAAYLLTDSLAWMLLWSAGLGAASSLAGYWIAHLLDVSIAGSMAAAAGLFFGLVYLAAPERGIAAIARRRRRQRRDFALQMLLVHLFQHEDLPEAAVECRTGHLHEHIDWNPEFARWVVRHGLKRKVIREAEEDYLRLTPEGRKLAEKSIVG